MNETSGPPTAGAILRESGPRLFVNGAGPILAFYAGWKTSGLALGVALAAAAGVGLFVFERRKGRPGVIARFTLCLILVQAAVGYLSGSTRIYLLQPAIVDSAMFLVFAGSVLAGRPLIGMFAREVFPMVDQLRETDVYRSIFGRLTLVWAAFMLVQGTIRLAVVLTGSVDRSVAVIAAGNLLPAPLIAWSIWYAVRTFRASLAPNTS